MTPQRALTLLALPLLAGPLLGAAAADRPTLTLSQSTELTAEGWVTISGSGFPANTANITVGQCPDVPTPHFLAQCNVQLGMQVVTINAAGEFGPLQIRLLAVLPDGTDCQITRCAILAVADANHATAPLASTPISFVAATPSPATTTPATTTPAAPGSTAPPAGSGSTGARSSLPDTRTSLWIGAGALAALLAFGAIAARLQRRPR